MQQNLSFKFLRFLPCIDKEKIKQATKIAVGNDPKPLSHYFIHCDGYDFYACVMFPEIDKLQITIKYLSSLESVPLGIGITFANIPQDMYLRLKEKTRDIEEIILDLKKTKDRLTKLAFHLEGYKRSHLSLVKDYHLYKEKFKQQRKDIKKYLKDAGIKVPTGSELSKLLSYDYNIDLNKIQASTQPNP